MALCPPMIPSLILGWQGRVIETTEDENGLVIVEIDTLRTMPEAYLEQSEQEGLGWSEYYLGAGEIQPAQPRDSQPLNLTAMAPEVGQ